MSFEIALSKNRTCDTSIAILEADGKTPIVLASTDVVRFKMFRRDQAVPLLDLDTVTPSAAGSGITVDQLEPARVTLRVAQADTAVLDLGTYDAEVDVVDDSETLPPKAIKLADHGIVHLLATGGGSIGIV
jgi:hypothetical protein